MMGLRWMKLSIAGSHPFTASRSPRFGFRKSYITSVYGTHSYAVHIEEGDQVDYKTGREITLVLSASYRRILG